MFDLFEMNFSNPAFLGYVNDCEEDYHKTQLDNIVEDLINYNLSIYDNPYDSRVICERYGIDFDYLSDDDYAYIVSKLNLAGIY